MAFKFSRMSFLVFPGDLNPYGNLFGGTIMQRIDICAAITARQILYKSSVPGIASVTRHISEVDFRVPAKNGDLLLLTGELISLGNSSINIKVTIEREDLKGTHEVLTTATVTMVSISCLNGTKVGHGLIIDEHGEIVRAES